MEARLPPDKLQRAIDRVAGTLKKQGIQHYNLESLVGLLSFATKVIPLGRPSRRSLYSALAKNKHFYTLNGAMKADLRGWLQLLRRLNGICLRRLAAKRHTFHAWTDASEKKGYGGYLLQQVDGEPSLDFTFSRRYGNRTTGRHQFQETYAFGELLRRYHNTLAGHCFHLKVDNKAVMYGLRKWAMSGQAMVPLRRIARILCLNDIQLIVDWIPTKDNTLADWLSRFCFRKIANYWLQIRQTKVSNLIRGTKPRTSLSIP